MHRLFSAILVLGCLACNKQSKEEIITCFEFDKLTLPLNNCSEKTASVSSPSICFEEIEDSRCPANVVCVWEGVAIAKFSLTEHSTQHQFKLSTKSRTGLPFA